MEPFAFVDLVPITAAALFLAITMGLGNPRLASNALAWGFALRLLQIGLRAADYGPFARTEDADRFARGSRALAEGGNGIYFRGGSQRWEHLLALGRRQLGLSVVGLEVTAVLIWLVAGWLVLTTIRSLTDDPRAERVLWLVALLPAGLLWTSGLLRESTEFAFAALAMYLYVRLQRTNVVVASSRAPVLAAATTLAIGGLLHEALFYAAVIFVVGSELLRIVMGPDGRPKPVATTVVVIGVIASAILLAGTIQTLLGAHESGFDNLGEAGYAMSPPSLGPLTTLVDLILRYVLYVVSPLVWTLRGPFDLIGFADAAVRIVLLVGAWRSRHRAPQVALLVMAVAIQFCFAVGTVNWGTAMRHHYVSLAPLAVAYAISTSLSRSHATDVEHVPPIPATARLVHA